MQKLKLVTREFQVPMPGGITRGQVLEYVDSTTPEEDLAVAEYFRLDQERAKPGWNYFKESHT